VGEELMGTVFATGCECGAAATRPGRKAAKTEVSPEKTVVFESEELDIPVFLRNK
jgi:hypothetical protein